MQTSVARFVKSAMFPREASAEQRLLNDFASIEKSLALFDRIGGLGMYR
jgi:hypothetical protein